MTHDAGNAASRGPSNVEADVAKPQSRLEFRNIRDRIIEGLLVMLPILVTLWIVWWIYSTLEKYAIDPLAVLVLWKVRNVKNAPELPYWFETYAAPIIAVLIALVFLYVCGTLAHSRLRRNFDALMLRVPVISHIYDAVKNVFQVMERPPEQKGPQRIVLVPFPHPGMRVPAIVTSTCNDIETGRVLLCVYVPTTPVPTSGYFLMIPEDEATELNWDVQQTLQAIISGGLSVPPSVSYFRVTSRAAAGQMPPFLSTGGAPTAGASGA